MKNILHHTQLDKSKWDKFVAEKQASIFSTSLYLDATAEDWCVYFDEENEVGFAIPIVEKLGVKGMYPPFFHRYVELIGTEKLPSALSEYLTTTYSVGFIHSKQQLSLPNEGERVHQEITNFDKASPSSQFKRSVKKAQKNDYQVKEIDEVESTFEMVLSFLSAKLDFYKSDEVEKLRKLILNLRNNKQLIVLGLISNDKTEGALFAMRHGDTITYLKGSCSDEITRNGGMYLLMQTLIERCKQENTTLDFGGSQVDGVRNFNLRLGGTDKTYYTYQWDNSPFWFKTLKKIRKWIKK